MKKSDISILIVEDDKSLREVIAEATKRKGYRAIAVSRPEEAESIVKIKPVHGLIVDVMLPGRNGVDLVMKLKENLIEGVGIVFVSGIYRDKSFSQEAISRTGALDYLTKPFDINELLGILDKKLVDYVEAPKVDLHSLLASPFASNRERRKALDHVEDMSGFDLPFVLCILMDAESSGHLNIVDDDQNIYGITFAKGAIVKFDSEATVLQTKKTLIQHGFITEMELSELQNKGLVGDLIRNLVDEGLMSPHAPGVIKSETILSGLRKIVTKKKISINFVPDRKIKPEAGDLDISAFIRPLHDLIESSLPMDWLKSFYAVWAGHPIRLGPLFSGCEQYLAMPLLNRADGIVKRLKSECTIEELVVALPQVSEENLYKALHFLMLRRVFVFEETKPVRNIDEHVNRLKSMHDELKDKDPIGIFNYFGLNTNPKPDDVIRIYKEFAKSHHPDTLPRAVSQEIQDLNHALFSKVTAAYEILSDKEKKEKYLNEKKQQEAELQIKSDDMITSALPLLNRGGYGEALPILNKALQLYESERGLLHYWWAKLKMDGAMTDSEVQGVQDQLLKMESSVRKTALWLFVSGLVRQHAGNVEGAKIDFQKSLQLDNKFVGARRELAQLRGAEPQKMTAEELLTGDLSTVVKNLFKRKKGA